MKKYQLKPPSKLYTILYFSYCGKTFTWIVWAEEKYGNHVGAFWFLVCGGGLPVEQRNVTFFFQDKFTAKLSHPSLKIILILVISN